ncbi:SRPBCC domain-containing protein [Schumannella sp. 10F1B-5-1]|uniref:SRPBCC family protein n=1 Tax=Schumannella sp. 10F1B-5-1 TaxID=2590780 RepID=UPI00113237F8|nr:SRPBCC domain-containing protein [Schumannella sp. 10F1B-5-1]TPW73427.1 SRPBCC domain-containing protein [Schumannella sp. 10F1B-5-1]
MTDLTVTRTFPFPAELVWSAWTTAEHFSAWFGGDQVEVPLDTLDYVAELGRAWKADMVLPDGNRIHWVGEFVEVDAPRHLRLTITDQPDDPARSHLVVDFAEVAGADGATGPATEVTMTQTPIPEGAEEALRQGYAHFFDTLEAELGRMAAA